ncbi:hypothetical protein NMG60_11026399 [Bertholletia excelsa]
MARRLIFGAVTEGILGLGGRIIEAVTKGRVPLEERLIEAATLGSVDLLNLVMAEDKLILDKVVLGSLSCNPLHTAAWYGHIKFVNKLLLLNPMLARLVDSMDRTALHLASAQGDVDVVKMLIQECPEMCITRDRNGKNPAHVAAMSGHVDALKELVQANPHAARARLDQDETVLHLCVKLNQLPSLEILLQMIDDEEFVNARDCDGNTILHLAVIGKQVEILKLVIEEKEIDINARNEQGHTAMDMLPRGNTTHHNDANDQMKAILLKADAKRKEAILQGEISKKRAALMVVTSFIAAITFQAGVSPPGGVWRENSDAHRAGESAIAYHYLYTWFLGCTTVGFVASLTPLLLLFNGFYLKNRIYRLVLMVVLAVAIASKASTRAVSISLGHSFEGQASSISNHSGCSNSILQRNTTYQV